MTAIEKLERVVRSLDKHLGRDLVAIDVKGVSAITDYFVFVTGGSNTQVKALCDYVEQDLASSGVQPARIEGYTTARWILVDYGEVVLHIFQQEARGFYDIERLWKDGTPVDLKQFLETEEI